MNKTHYTSDRHFLSLASSLGSRLALLTILSGVLSSAAFAAQSCDGLKHEIEANGAYLYHYADKKEPDLDLYVRYVNTDDKCDGGKILEPRLVPNLENCYIPTCIIGPGEDDR